MRSSKVLGVFIAVALILVPSAGFAGSTEPVISEETIKGTPSKVCHPKKPITCRASDLQIDMAELLTPQVQPEQNALICIGPRWLCYRDVFQADDAWMKAVTEPQVEREEALICIGPRWLCRVDILN